MSHIHTKPGQHDTTVSAWIFREDDGGRKVLVHMHRKIQKYMQVGGHIELNETPWQAIAHELEEESGYSLSELEVYQPLYMPRITSSGIVHPTPVFIDTHQPTPEHYHTDIRYAFLAKDLPKHPPAEGESEDVRWYTLEQLKKEPLVLKDILGSYELINNIIDTPYMHRVATSEFSLEEPSINQDAIEKVKDTVLEVTRFGNPVLRSVAALLSDEEITSTETRALIRAMFSRLKSDDGVGLAAPQVGVSKALAVIDIHPNVYHPERETFKAVIINPSYEGIGRHSSLWEGCLSSGSDKNVLFAKALRYSKITAHFTDEKGAQHTEQLEGLRAQVFQHETDHLHGILFVDRVRDTSSYMTGDEYRKRILGEGSHDGD